DADLGANGLSLFIVERDTPGLGIGPKEDKMGMRASPTSELMLDHCEVPVENRMGEENDSVAHMLNGLNIERITISGISLGLAQACLKFSSIYAKDRTQFGKPISEYQMVQERIAETAANLEAGRSLCYASAREYDQGDRNPALGAQAKLFSAQMATKAGLDAIQILGGYGYTQDYPVERYMRDAKLMEIGAGTNEVMRLVISKAILGLHGK
ncbi:MAG: isovaleryl-CoA dehydrogenase, partial [Chloroflexi bacterium]|nr:isovaleryl-CoA dehydrogenase [Chloroflexota bacterium]